MKTIIKKLSIVAMITVAAMFLLVGCGYQTVSDGSTGVVIKDGVVSNEYLQPGRYPDETGERTVIKTIDNKIQQAYYSGPIEGQSKDDIIVNAASYGFSGRIGSGEKSVWLVKNVTFESDRIQDIIPSSLVESALKDALLEVEAKNVTKRMYVEPIFKKLLQERIDEHFGYKKGDDTSLITVNSVSIGNLSPEEEYDKELSRAEILRKRAENDTKQFQLDREKAEAEAEVELARVNAQSEVELAKARTEAELAKIEAEKEAAEWATLSKYFTSEELVELKKIETLAAKWDGEYHPDGLSGLLFKLDDGGSSSKGGGSSKEE